MVFGPVNDNVADKGKCYGYRPESIIIFLIPSNADDRGGRRHARRNRTAQIRTAPEQNPIR